MIHFKPFEAEAKALGHRFIAGVDEAGRGPLAGPVVAAACIILSDGDFPHLNDSKLMTEKERENLFDSLPARSDLYYGIGVVDHETIDRINILQATFLAMQQAVSQLPVDPDLLLIDGPLAWKTKIPVQTIVKGDRLCQSIALASVLAKVTRDRMMRDFNQIYPQYKFAQHKGYPTALHAEMIRQYGLSPIHRKSFKVNRNASSIK
jgi:ribonuclease HII